jgi:hypothetical protein
LPSGPVRRRYARDVSLLQPAIANGTAVVKARILSTGKCGHGIKSRGRARHSDFDAFTVYQSTILMLENLLESAPTDIVAEPMELGGDFAIKRASAQGFIDLVRRKLDPGSWRRSDFENVMRSAESIAERQLEETPVEQRPNGIDHLALRRWVIVHLQCARAIIFLQAQKREAEENLRNQRSNLLDRYRLRNPG